MNEMIIFYLEIMNDVLMIVWRSSRGEVYEGCLVVILYDGV